MQNNQKMFKLMLSVVALMLVVVITLTTKNTGERDETTTDITSTFSTNVVETITDATSETEAESINVIIQYSSQNETEIMSEAPTDSSDWEIHRPSNDEPDTGETIPE